MNTKTNKFIEGALASYILFLIGVRNLYYSIICRVGVYLVCMVANTTTKVPKPNKGSPQSKID